MANDWVEAMRAGDFARAWAINDRDLAVLAYPPKHTGPRHLQRIWRGEPLTDRHVLVRCYHGLGDTLQFLRFMQPLRDLARSVTVWCQAGLLPLVERTTGVDRALALHEGTPETDFEVDIEIMEVPHALKVGREQVEMPAPYLTLPARSTPVSVDGEVLAVGLVWEVGQWDKRRAIAPAMLRHLAVPGVALHSLQRDAPAEDLIPIGACDISTPDIPTLGHLLCQLDLAICVDTMVAHLAGALGCEAWVLLHADCDWRWPSSGCRSLWYPSLRLFRQKAAGDWGAVISEVAEALRGRANCSKGSHKYRQAGTTAALADSNWAGRAL
ncbi:MULTISPECIES: hypothetical protein [unclassified Bradyrhizobium]|uniref:hypothetical protein n=1 Tax=unclassified Bradyrhizobium TaxID=2631580 RepID=UPI00181DBD74|nr:MULTISPECIES: hypothetical protein [unclassified Bradyrhizobium]MBB4256073.1 hypothetical protein [Bradyrhizobium sp. CIR3A]NYG48241.1 hypothetical protein [Bradyrhizobium sp. IAR9]